VTRTTCPIAVVPLPEGQEALPEGLEDDKQQNKAGQGRDKLAERWHESGL